MELATIKGEGYTITYNTGTMLGEVQLPTLSVGLSESDVKLLVEADEVTRRGIVQQIVNNFVKWRGAKR